jgi:hypothetical protein
MTQPLKKSRTANPARTQQRIHTIRSPWGEFSPLSLSTEQEIQRYVPASFQFHFLPCNHFFVLMVY